MLNGEAAEGGAIAAAGDVVFAGANILEVVADAAKLRFIPAVLPVFSGIEGGLRLFMLSPTAFDP